MSFLFLFLAIFSMQSQRKSAGLLCNYAKLPEDNPGGAFSVALGGMAVTQGHS